MYRVIHISKVSDYNGVDVNTIYRIEQHYFQHGDGKYKPTINFYAFPHNSSIRDGGPYAVAKFIVKIKDNGQNIQLPAQ